MSRQTIDMFRMSCGASAPLELSISGPGRAHGERRVFEDPFVLIGRDERSCLRLEDGEISRRHAYLQQFGERVFCVDLASRTGIRWGGKPRPAGWLSPEQGIQIGPFTLELARTRGTGQGLGERRAEDWDPLRDRKSDPLFLPGVTVELGDEVLSRCSLNRVLVLVGNAPACRVRLRGAGVSRYHCSLLRTPQGVWLIDLLSGSGTYLNGEWLRWTLVREGDRFQVGPYMLRVSYPEVGTEALAPEPEMIPARTPVPLLSHGQEDLEPAGTPEPEVAPALQAELDLLRERQEQAEILRRQLAEKQAECDQLREEARAFEVQLAEAAGLQTRLDAAQASIGDLEVIRQEREHWQAEARNHQDRLTAASVEREQWQQRLEALQQRLDKEGEAVRAAEARREQESTALEKARAEQAQLRVRLAELEDQASAADRLEAQFRDASTEIERLRSQLETAEARGSELESVRAECDRLREQVRAFEVQLAEAADLQSRLDAAQASIGDLEVIRQEREHWQAEARNHQNRLTAASAEREEWQQRLEALQQRLDKEGEAVRAAEARREQESTALEKTRVELATRNAEHEAALHRLQQTQEEFARSQEEASRLQTELEHALDGQRNVESLSQQLAETGIEQAQLRARLAELVSQASAADRLEAQFRDANTEMEQLRSQLETAEARGSELESVRVECDRFREQARAFEVQLAEAAGLQTRLDAAQASIGDLEVIRQEREHWQAEAQNHQDRLAAASVEREQWQQRLEALQQRLDKEGEAVRAAEARREEESTALEKARAELVIRNAEHEAALQRLQQTQEEFARSQKEASRLQTELEHALEDQQDLASLRQQLAESHTEQAQLRARLAELENQANAAQEELDRLPAELDAVKEERERLRMEHQTARQSSEQAQARVSELERALTEARAAHETALTEARAGWDLDRQALEARLVLEGQTSRGGSEDAARDALAQNAAEREQWRQLLQGAESQLIWERGMFQEQSEQFRRQVAALQAERDRLAARLAQAELEPKRPPTPPEPMLVPDPGILPGRIPALPSRTGNANAPAGSGSPQALLTRGRSAAEEQRRLNAIAQEIHAAWGEATPPPEGLPAISIPAGAVEVPSSEGSLATGGEIAVEHPSEPPVPHSPAQLGGSQPTADAHASLPPGKQSRPWLWRQILGYVLGK